VSARPRAKRTQPPGVVEDVGVFGIPHVGERRVRLYSPAVKRVDLPRPLLVLFDGQNVFDDAGSYAGGWYAHRAVDRLVPKRVCVAPWVVAIDHGHGRRIDELGPWSGRHGGGLTAHLADWIADRLVLELRGRRPLLHGPGAVVLGGSSMGGLAALWCHFARPDAFGGAIAMSPSLWFANRRVFDDVRARPRPVYSRVYVDCGVGEARGAMEPLARAFALELASRGYHERNLRYVADKRGTHSERAWRRRLPRALEFMFRTRP
jgi:predicted alpha/beta superfamily hydrolase